METDNSKTFVQLIVAYSIGVTPTTLRLLGPAYKILPGTYRHGQDFKNTSKSMVMPVPRLSLRIFSQSKYILFLFIVIFLT